MKRLLPNVLFRVLVVALLPLVFQAQSQTSPHRPPRKQGQQSSRGATTSAAAEAIRLNNLGTAYMNQQQFEKALQLFSDAVAKNPKFDVAKVNRGIALLNLQRYDEARQVLSEATTRDPRSSRAWYNLGLAYKAVGQSQLALPAFQKAAELEPADTDCFYLVASMQAQLGQTREAIVSFQKSLQLAPENASAEFGLARALQRVNDASGAKAHLARFDEITKNKQGKLMSPGYGEQGVLSVAAPARGEQVLAPATQVKFVDASRQSGLAHDGVMPATMEPPSSAAACFFDYDNDNRPDLLVSALGGRKPGAVLYHNIAGRFDAVTAKALPDFPEPLLACAAGDFDNDGFTDLAVGFENGTRLFRNDGKEHFVDVTVRSAISTRSGPSAFTFIDYDHDGDLDLLVMTSSADAKTGSRIQMWRNNGNGSFTDVTDSLGLHLDSDPGMAAVSDINNDRASDILLSGPALIFVNPREGPWRKLPVEASSPAMPNRGMVIVDFDKDGYMDVALATSNGVLLYRNDKGQRFERIDTPSFQIGPVYGMSALDYDNDGWIDLAVVGNDNRGHSYVRLFRNTGKTGFANVSKEVGLENISVSLPRTLLAADYDGDGDTDLLVVQAGGSLLLLRNDGGDQNNFLRISLKGLADNKNAVGAKVEVFAGAKWQKWEVSPSSYGGQTSTEIVAGLGKEKSVDVVRMLWPTGVVQDEAQIPARSVKVIGEIDRRGSSCPLLFVWDGKRYEFVADMIGAGVVGHWISPDHKNTPDPTEYIKVENVQPALRDGRLSFRFMEPMEEIVYLDQVRLLAIDHPSGVDVYPNEYFASSPPSPEFKIVASANAVPPAGAWDDAGRDVLKPLLARDHEYVTGFKVTKWTGFAEPHSLALELPQPYQGGSLHLLMNGYIEYFMANSMYAAYQAGIEPFAPYLEAQATDGRWVRVVDDIGFPAGLHRTITVDLTGKLPSGTRRVRLTTNLQIYWDQILVDSTSPSEAFTRVTEVPLSSASLSWHGYPRMIEASTPGDLTFEYENVSPTGPYVRQAGAYTRYGDVVDLLRRVDDRFAVFGSGDEVQVDFDPQGLPQLPSGWRRDYFFFADGFEKDMDFYAADGLTVNPMPFHSMREYPYGSVERFPEDAEHVQYRLKYNTRHEAGAWPSSFRFVYKGAPNR